MRFVSFVAAITLAASSWLQAQTSEPPAAVQAPPQTARQALLEMFLSKATGAFEKHLPAVAHETLIGKGEAQQFSVLGQIERAGRQWASGGHLETYDEGSLLLVSEPEGGREKIEIVVEQDSLMGEEDVIEVSVRSYVNGEPEFIPVLPRVSFTMKEEKEIWKLSEITLSGRVPLEDPDYLKGVRKEQDQVNERMALSRISMIVSIENNYAAQHPDKGYSCKIGDLFADQTAIASDDSGGVDMAHMLEDSNGYHFALQGCNDSPASRFQLTAVPVDAESAQKAYCTDQSGKVRFSAEGKGPACLSSGR